ncbi:sulfite exporter TauE/SafE family protein [Pelobium sp.]|nr:sulfite exporter TauE/SafE family protein [Pelobium sp.]MDA9555075.1 sulfite exporter TauE/SafE family protein [Pelobium sp.]
MVHASSLLLQTNQSSIINRNLPKLIILSIGAVVGFLSGLLGKGGSAITTPLLQIFAGINPFAALASPLPTTLPTTLSASAAYFKENLIDKRVVIWSIILGIPATAMGSFFSEWFGGNFLMILTAIFVLSLGISFFFNKAPKDFTDNKPIPFWKIMLIAISVGFLSGLLANSGGVLFAPLFIRFFKMPTKQALASSLLVAAGLAIPGTIAHWYLGHIDWQIVLLLAFSSIPFSYLGAKTSIKMDNTRLEKIFGLMLVLFGAFDLWYSIFK